MRETNAIYKISILYMLSRAEYPISTNRLSFFLLKNNYTNYFIFQQDLGELIDDGYVTKDFVHGKTLYSLTEDGRTALKLMKNEISESMKLDIDEYLKDNRLQIHEDFAVKSHSYQLDLTHFVSNLVIEEDKEKLLEINIAVGDKAQADRICANWKEQSEDIYPMLLGALLKKSKLEKE